MCRTVDRRDATQRDTADARREIEIGEDRRHGPHVVQRRRRGLPSLRDALERVSNLGRRQRRERGDVVFDRFDFWRGCGFGFGAGHVSDFLA